MIRRNWNRNELLLALNLYCSLPFGQYHSHNNEIIWLAAYIDRTPSAVAMKLSNFASFDPSHQARGIKGLQNAGKADWEIWDDFHHNWSRLATESEIVYSQMITDQATTRERKGNTSLRADTLVTPERTEGQRLVKVRLGQQFFRRVILISYGYACCVCGIPIPDMLIASHIVPWRDDENLRVSPYNGLCLCALHDKGFDRGYFTLSDDYEVIVSKALRPYLPNAALQDYFERYAGRPISLPDKFIPEPSFLRTHRHNYFRS